MRRIIQFCRVFQKTASCLVIGDEILSGDTIDSNSPFLANFLSRNGVYLEEIRTIPDDINKIKDHLIELSSFYDFVFTSGGIGSTHDDVTYESVALAFGVDLELNHLVSDRIESIIPSERICNATYRMATLPENSECFFHDDYFCPLARIENVYILPGVSSIFEELLECNKDLFYDPDHIRFSLEAGTNLPESFVSDSLRSIASKYENISFGSYPIGRKRIKGDINVRIKITAFESHREEAIEALNEILNEIDSFVIVGE